MLVAFVYEYGDLLALACVVIYAAHRSARAHPEMDTDWSEREW